MAYTACAAAAVADQPDQGRARFSDDLAWELLDAAPSATADKQPWVQPDVYQAARLNPDALKATLIQAPLEFTPAAAQAPLIISLPMPHGTFARFRVVESPVMAPALAAKFPEIKTYLGQGIDDPAASARLDWTPAGFHAQVLSPNGAVYIDPFWRDDVEHYACYYKRDYRGLGQPFECEFDDHEGRSTRAPVAQFSSSGETLRTYRVAIAATGEYTAFHGGTVSAGMSAIVTALNRVTGIYEVEVAVRMVLIANNDLIVYTNGATDPYSNGNGSTMLGQNQSNLNSVIGAANYDIGHVFSTGGGGIASLSVVCNNGSKARGVTGLPSPIGDVFYVDYVAHEMGHQFGANHPFNGINGSCNGNRFGPSAYEPGSGSTIMGYAGICNSDNLQLHSDPYFVHKSLDEIISFTTAGGGTACDVPTSTGNLPPAVDAGSSYTIPMSTPFILTASGSDPNGDTVSYTWEERDLGPAQALSAPDNGSSPLMRSWNPSTNPTRTMPLLSFLLANSTPNGERLPTTNRNMNFRVTARDNRAGGGGIASDNMVVSVTTSAGPFAVTTPNTSVTWAGTKTVTWSVANTDQSPVNTGFVNIRLSTNGGSTFPTVLAANTPNDGSESVTLPIIQTSSARIKVEAVNNIFFDISNTNFTITEPVPDVTPPTPNPMTFAVAPSAASTTSISMTATTATDDTPPIQYEFDFTTGGSGGADSAWQSSTSYTDTGLNPNVRYAYRVRARDSVNPQNVTQYSVEKEAYTLANTPAAPTLSNPTTSSINLDVQPNGNPFATAFAIQCLDTSPADPVWEGRYVNSIGQPATGATWRADSQWGVITVQDLNPTTSYTFRVKARNEDLIETSFGPTAALQTHTCDANPDCDDSNPCTDDACVGGECVIENNSDPCTDLNSCTTGDTCVNGACVGQPVNCDDDNVCTDDSCNEIDGECNNDPIQGPCDDGDACTTGDVCASGQCVGDPVVCDDGDPCTDDFCDSADGSCVTVKGTGPCDDGDACTTGDTCTSGQCVGDPVVCDDGNPCTDDSCDPADGSCVTVNNTIPCDDDDPCTSADVCTAGECTGTLNRYADVNHDGEVDILDIFCVLDGFVDNFTNCTFNDLDIGGCVANGQIDIFDIFGVLDAFAGVDVCGCL